MWGSVEVKGGRRAARCVAVAVLTVLATLGVAGSAAADDPVVSAFLRVSPQPDAGTFDLLINGVVKKEAAENQDFTDDVSMPAGSTATVEVRASAGSPVALDQYTASIICDVSREATSVSFTLTANTECLISLVRKPPKLTVVNKSGPAGDPGRFDIALREGQASQRVVIKENAGDGDSTTIDARRGTTYAIEVTGNAPSTSAEDYDTTLDCGAGPKPATRFQLPSGAIGNTGNVEIQGDTTCTVTNTHVFQPTITLRAHTVPASDPLRVRLWIFRLGPGYTTLNPSAGNGDSGTIRVDLAQTLSAGVYTAGQDSTDVPPLYTIKTDCGAGRIATGYRIELPTVATDTTCDVTLTKSDAGGGPGASAHTGKLTMSSLAKTGKLVALLNMATSTAKKVKFTLPKGLTLNRAKLAKGLKIRANGKAAKVKVTSKSGSLSFTLAGTGAKTVEITISRGALKVSKKLVKSVKAEKGGQLTGSFAVTDAANKSSTLTLSGAAR